jgi:SAM-dependent methyltransferase
MSTIFKWKVEEFDYLLDSCNWDPITPHIFKYFSPPGPILEAGCGSSRFVKFLYDKGYDCRGIEYSNKTVEDVKDKWPELQVIEGDVRKMPYPDNMFKGIISIGVVEHFEEGPEKALAEMRRVLERGGIALITVPCLNWLRRLKGPLCGITHAVRANPIVRKIFGRSRLKHPGWNLYNSRYRYHVYPEWGDFYEYRFTPYQFEEILKKSQFEILESVPIHQVDGLYHEFGRLFARYKHCQFYMFPHGKLLNWLLSKIPFFHNHMILCVVRK